jgi:hypothetical protein
MEVVGMVVPTKVVIRGCLIPGWDSKGVKPHSIWLSPWNLITKAISEYIVHCYCGADLRPRVVGVKQGQ